MTDMPFSDPGPGTRNAGPGLCGSEKASIPGKYFPIRRNAGHPILGYA